MSKKAIPILHVDGSLTEYVDKQGVLRQVAGVGGYLVIEGKVKHKFHQTLESHPHLNHHEEYAILEGMKWVQTLGLDTLRIKTDSMYAVDLFTKNKKNLNKIDKFFLIQFLALDYAFEWVEIVYHNRKDNDLSHLLSRKYILELPKDIIKLHVEHVKKNQLNITHDTTKVTSRVIDHFLYKKMLDYFQCYNNK